MRRSYLEHDYIENTYTVKLFDENNNVVHVNQYPNYNAAQTVRENWERGLGPNLITE